MTTDLTVLKFQVSTWGFLRKLRYSHRTSFHDAIEVTLTNKLGSITPRRYVGYQRCCYWHAADCRISRYRAKTRSKTILESPEPFFNACLVLLTARSTHPSDDGRYTDYRTYLIFKAQRLVNSSLVNYYY